MEENTVNAVQEAVVEPQSNVTESVHGEVATPQTQEPQVADKAVQTPEENSKFAEIRRKAEAEKAEAVKQAKLEAQQEFIKNEYGFESIDEYQKAKSEREIQKRADKFMQDGLSEEYARQLAESESIKLENQRLTSEKRKKAEMEAKIQKENQDFLDYYKELNGKDYDKTDGLPDEVWAKVNSGTPLKYAYMEHQMEQLRIGTQTQQQNEQHAQQTTGSVQGVNAAPDKPLTKEEFEKMSEKEISRRWPEVKKLFNIR